MTRQLVAAKQELRRLVTEVEHLETRLANIDSSEQYLIDGGSRRNGLSAIDQTP